MSRVLVSVVLLLCAAGAQAQGRGKCVAECHELAFEKESGACSTYSAKLYKACGSAHREGVKQACGQLCAGKPSRELSLRLDKACNHLREALPKPTMHQACVKGYQQAFDMTAKFTDEEMDRLRAFMKPSATKPAPPQEQAVPEPAKRQTKEEPVMEQEKLQEAPAVPAAPVEEVAVPEPIKKDIKIGKVPIDVHAQEAKEKPKVVLSEPAVVDALLTAKPKQQEEAAAPAVEQAVPEPVPVVVEEVVKVEEVVVVEEPAKVEEVLPAFIEEPVNAEEQAPKKKKLKKSAAAAQKEAEEEAAAIADALAAAVEAEAVLPSEPIVAAELPVVLEEDAAVARKTLEREEETAAL